MTSASPRDATVAIMQPYFFPYLGYFQLMAASGTFVFLDDVQYIERGWVNRNRILENGAASWLTVPVAGASHDLAINQRHYLLDGNLKAKLLRRIDHIYAKAPHFARTRALLDEIMGFADLNVAAFNENLLRVVATALKLPVKFARSSQIDPEKTERGQDRIIALCKKLGAASYVNAIGGTELYAGEAFSAAEIALGFVKPGDLQYKQFSREPVANLSVIDVLMFNDPPAIQHLLSRWELVRP